MRQKVPSSLVSVKKSYSQLWRNYLGWLLLFCLSLPKPEIQTYKKFEIDYYFIFQSSFPKSWPISPTMADEQEQVRPISGLLTLPNDQ